MLKILIVDDVSIFLEYLRGCIDWETYGFQICGEAHDGVEALGMIEEVYPDIILTDIVMPYMDGLTFAEKVAQHYPNISTILITGNSEFEYARKALKIGVCDYIVKPFEKEELLISLLKQKDNINNALETRNLQAALELEQQELLLRKLILGRHQSWEKHIEQLEKAGINFTSDFFMVCTLKFMPDQISLLEEINDWEDIIVDMLKGRIDINGSFHVFKDYENNIVVLMNFATEKEMKSYKSYELSDIKKIIKKQLSIDSLLGISEFCYSVDEIKTAYSQSINAINTSLSMNAEDNTTINLLYSWDMIDKLTKGFEQLNENLITETIDAEFTHIREIGNEQMIQGLCTGLISILLTNVINSGRTIEAVFGSDFHPYHAISNISDTDALYKLVLDYYLTAIRYRERNTNTRSHQIVEQVKEYIHSNYMDHNLCVADISKATLINQTYLRSMFKSEMNLTITEYITKYRMTLAKQMLQETEDKIAVVAEKVGFNDESYFSKSFKKYYGVSPKSI